MDLQEKLEIYMPVIEASNLFLCHRKVTDHQSHGLSWRLCSGF